VAHNKGPHGCSTVPPPDVPNQTSQLREL